MAEVDITPPLPSLAGGLLPSALQLSMDPSSGVGVVSAPPGQGQGMGKWAYSGRAVHYRDQASWTFTSFLVAFVLPIHGADVITC